MKIINCTLRYLLPDMFSYCLLGECVFYHSPRVTEDYPIYHNECIYIGNMWRQSWKPLEFERNVLYG